VVAAPQSSPVVAAPQSSPVVAAPQSSPVVAAPQLSPIIEESSTTPVIEPSSPIVAASQPSPIIEESSTTPIVAEPSLPSPVIKESAIPPQKPILVEELPTPLPIGARYEAFFESLENAGVKRKRLEDDDFDDITKKAKVFGWENLHPVKTPLPTDAALKTISESPLLDDAGKQKYQQLVGCLLWASVTTRPDIAYAVQFLARSMANPTEVVFSTAKHCMRYLYTTRSLAITYQSDTNNQQLSMYTDAAFADCLSTRRSTSAYIAVLAGAPISWRSSRQHINTLHSTEAEYVALVDAGKELLWLNRLTNEISPNPGVPTLLCDNIAAITIANGVDKGRTRYIDNYYHWTRMHVARKDFVLDHISGTDQLADGLTKPFSSIQHQRFLQCLGFAFRPRVPRSLEQNTSHAGGVSGKTCLTTIVEEVCG
jgi:hypothetical protein